MNHVDPVEEFFDRERRTVAPQPGDDQHWGAIVDAHRRSRRSRWTGFAAGAAAAAVLVGAVGYALRPTDDSALPSTQTPLSSSRPPTGSSTPATSSTPGEQTTTPATTAPKPPTTATVPADFRLVSVSQASDDVVFGLGTTNCKGHACTQVVRSLDAGKTWRAVATFGQDVDTPGKTSSGRVGTDSSLTDIRMANTQVGWAFGGGLKMTTDGGFHWVDYGHEGKAVVDLATDGKQVVLVAASGDCNGKTCDGQLLVQQSAVGGPPPTTVGRLSGGQILGASVSFARGHAVVSGYDSGGPAGVAQQSIVTDKGLQSVTMPGCSTAGGAPATVVTAADQQGLFGFCAGGGAAGQTGYVVSSSADGGLTWTQVSGNPPLLLSNAGYTSYAAADSTHLLAVSGGDPALHGSMQVSQDGGRTWHGPKSAPPMPDRGWAWVGAPGGSRYYAVPVGGASALWLSTDKGETWKQAQVAG